MCINMVSLGQHNKVSSLVLLLCEGLHLDLPSEVILVVSLL